MHIKFSTILLITVAIFCVSCSCNNNNKDNNNGDPYIAPENPDTIARLQEVEITGTRKVNGSDFSYRCKLTPNDTLPIITSFTGQRYFDNEVLLTISGAQGEILKKTYTKKSFLDFVPSDKINTMSLVGFNYYMAKEEDTSNMYFIAMIGDPEDNDENQYVIELCVGASGEVKMSKANMEDFETTPLDYSEEDNK